MLHRKIEEKIIDWIRNSKKALLIDGARQVGKTFIIRKVLEDEGCDYIEFNLLKTPALVNLLDKSDTVDDMIANLSLFADKPFIRGKTFLFFDEIQEFKELATKIKFWVDEGSFRYVFSGSLLGVELKNIKSAPVGYLTTFTMYPLDFEEYMWANGIQSSTFEYLKGCYDNTTKVSDSIHETLSKLFYSYLVVGGMPENVQIYVDTHDIAKVVMNQRSILDLYRLDIAKYASENEKAKIKAIYDSIPSQLNEKNRRFKLSSIHPDARMLRYEDCFNWLTDAGVALACYNVAEPQPPLQLSEKRNLFKLYMGDVGLLCAACMENVQFDLLMGNVDVNMGSILENAFAQNLQAGGFHLNYYDSKKIGELDFVLQRGLSVELVEVKSGNDYHKHKALDRALQVENWKFKESVVFSKGNIESENGITYLPWYMVIFFHQEKEPDQMIYEIDLSDL